MRLAVLGNGAFGTALAMAGCRAGHSVAVWGHDPDYTAAIAQSRRNPRYLGGEVEIPGQILISHDADLVLQGAELVIVAVPTQHVRSVLVVVRDRLPAGVDVISTAKGLEQESSLRPSRILAEVLGPDHAVLVLSGPSHAEEVARELPTIVVLAGAQLAIARRCQSALSSSSLRIYTNRDLLGVELCGALKNVMALAAGMGEGLGFGDNAKAAILARGIAEMVRYGVAEGAEPETFFGLAGVGGLAVTAFSRHGRNRAFGERIGRGETLEQVLASTRKVAEGVWTSRVVRARAGELGIEMPICDAVCAVLFEGLEPMRAVAALMERDPKSEVGG